MDINVAKTFLEIVKTGSFGGAASNLNLTQTAVSARIRALEDVLERPVFVRNKAGARLTPEGERFLRFATSLVQVWDRARRAVALPPEHDNVALVGAELSLWNPLLMHWLLWMRREAPGVAISTVIERSDTLMSRVQDGTIDVAVIYGAPHRPGIVTELLFEEKLVLVQTASAGEVLDLGAHVLVDWGGDFLAGYKAAFPDNPSPVVTIDYGPLALEYMIAAGGSGYFRKGFVRSHLESGQLRLVSDAPEFPYSAYLVHSTKSDKGVIDLIRNGFRLAAAITA
jgi:LysR family transcriptional regulator, flagellar master operon regulator